jgi:hypothetical protein
MRRMLAAAILLAGLGLSRPTAALAAAQSTNSGMPGKSPSVTVPVPNHALTGIVKSVDAMTLVVTRAGKNPREMTFSLSPFTQRDGEVAVGARVEVRFRTKGRMQIATAIFAPTGMPRGPARPGSAGW